MCFLIVEFQNRVPQLHRFLLTSSIAVPLFSFCDSLRIPHSRISTIPQEGGFMSHLKGGVWRCALIGKRFLVWAVVTRETGGKLRLVELGLAPRSLSRPS